MCQPTLLSFCHTRSLEQGVRSFRTRKSGRGRTLHRARAARVYQDLLKVVATPRHGMRDHLLLHQHALPGVEVLPHDTHTPAVESDVDSDHHLHGVRYTEILEFGDASVIR